MLIRVGKCNQCGVCCDNERAIEVAKNLTNRRIAFKIADYFPCYHSHNENGKSVCGIYENRPQFCRDFPMSAEDLQDYPECSYKFIEEGKNNETKL